MLLVTIDTGYSKHKLLQDSCRKHGIPLLVTQASTKWVGFKHNKWDLFALQLGKLTYEWFIFADAYDVFVARPDALNRSFELLGDRGRDILYSGETNCWPWPKRHGCLAKFGRFPYANSGVYVAKREAWLAAYDELADWDDGYEEQERSVAKGNCDQLYAHELVARGRASVDSLGEWTLNLYGLHRKEAEARMQDVCFVHGSSPENKALVRSLWLAQ